MAIGVSDSTISPHLLAFIQSDGVTVVGVVADGTSRQLTGNWNAPFEQDSISSRTEKVGGIVQNATGVGYHPIMQGTQVWSGNAPIEFSLVLNFYAINDAYNEVTKAIIELEKMASPDVSKVAPFARAPEKTSVQLGKSILYPECIVTVVSHDLSGPRHKSGNLLRATVSLTVSTKSSVNKTDIQQSFG